MDITPAMGFMAACFLAWLVIAWIYTGSRNQDKYEDLLMSISVLAILAAVVVSGCYIIELIVLL